MHLVPAQYVVLRNFAPPAVRAQVLVPLEDALEWHD
jgi:hypothetical protein